RIVNLGRDAVLPKSRSESVSTLRPNDILVIDVDRAFRHERQADRLPQAKFCEQCPVPLGIALPRRGPRGKVLQLDAKNRGLQGVQPAIHTQDFVTVLFAAAMLSQ